MSMKRSRLEAESVGEDVLAAPVMSSVVTLFGAVRQDKRGFVNAADLARASGTTTQAYLKNEKNNLFVKTLASKLHVLPSDLVVMGQGGGVRRDPMFHPVVAMDLARWCSPVLAVQLSGVLFQYFAGKLTTEHSVAAHQVGGVRMMDFLDCFLTKPYMPCTRHDHF